MLVRRKLTIVFIVILAVICLLGAGIAVLFLMNRDRPGFLKGTSLNGEDISGRTVSELVSREKEQLDGMKIQILEDGRTALEGSLGDYGYTFDEPAYKRSLEQALTEQKHNVFVMLKTLAGGSDISGKSAYKKDDEVNRAFLVSSSFKMPRVKSQDASYVLNKKTDLYEIADAVQGNEIDDSKLQKYVNTKIEKALEGEDLQGKDLLKVDVPDEVYSSRKVSNDKTELKKNLAAKNKAYRLEEYKKMSVTYQFGSKTQVLDGETISRWVKISDDLKAAVDEQAVKEYAASLAAKYDTRYKQRSFKTTGGQVKQISASANEYGYTIEQAQEAAQLKKDIEARKSVTREPVYYKTNSYGNPLYYSRDGVDDLNGTYVEINLSAQHLWFYKKGKLIVESDFVSGNVQHKTETVTGCFPLAYKKSPAKLTGQNAMDSWDSDVDYWMPFYNGQGMHDASWRSSFGGSIYKTNGSHGCVNLPHSAAERIYKNISAGTAIVLYK